MLSPECLKSRCSCGKGRVSRALGEAAWREDSCHGVLWGPLHGPDAGLHPGGTTWVERRGREGQGLMRCAGPARPRGLLSLITCFRLSVAMETG